MQFPESTQGFNRYAYAGNNPLTNVDPSGFSFWKKLLKIVGFVINFIPGFQGWANAFIRGLISGFLSSGGDLKAGLLSAVTAGLGSGISSGLSKAFGVVRGFVTNLVGSVIASVAVGVAMGQKFGAALLSTVVGIARGFATNLVAHATGIADLIADAFSAGTAEARDGLSGGTENGGKSEAAVAAVSAAPEDSETRSFGGSVAFDKEAGDAATQEANVALEKAGVLTTTYTTAESAASAWGGAGMNEITAKYKTELTSGIFRVKGGYKVGPAVSNGVICRGDTYCFTTAPDKLPTVAGGALAGQVHTHPSNTRMAVGSPILFDRTRWKFVTGVHGDIGVALHNRISMFVSLPNGQVWGWDYAKWHAAMSKAPPGVYDAMRYERRVR
jgi:hypothetical protein